jgi:hypothetical protein
MSTLDDLEPILVELCKHVSRARDEDPAKARAMVIRILTEMKATILKVGREVPENLEEHLRELQGVGEHGASPA